MHAAATLTRLLFQIVPIDNHCGLDVTFADNQYLVVEEVVMVSGSSPTALLALI